MRHPSKSITNCLDETGRLSGCPSFGGRAHHVYIFLQCFVPALYMFPVFRQPFRHFKTPQIDRFAYFNCSEYVLMYAVYIQNGGWPKSASSE